MFAQDAELKLGLAMKMMLEQNSSSVKSVVNVPVNSKLQRGKN